ncbi:MAG: hypothetical protein WA484_08145 [Solirubrobacteraceae bacterium]
MSALENCMRTIGITDVTLSVTIGDHEGKLDSLQELRDELTEGRWLSSHVISVSLQPSEWEHTSLSVRLDSQQPVLFVYYHSGTMQERETMRVVVERALGPEPPDPRRYWRRVGPIFGVLYAATIVLLDSRVIPAHWSIHTGWSRAVRDSIGVAGYLALVASGTYWPWLALQFWFPPLEKLPDTARTHWDRRRAWVQWGLGVWVTVVIGLLALPASK